jgi:anti-anti-sigma regulatory factor
MQLNIMDYSVENIEGILVLTVKLQRATFIESEYFQKLLDGFISEGNKKLIIDLGATNFIDPVFLGSIIAEYRKLVAIGGEIKLVKPSLDSSNLNIIHSLRIFEIFNSKEEAIKSFKYIFTSPLGDIISFGNFESGNLSYSFS